MHFINDINLVSGFQGPITDPINQLTYIVDPGPAGCIHFNDIDVPIFSDSNAMGTDSTGFGRSLPFSINRYTI